MKKTVGRPPIYPKNEQLTPEECAIYSSYHLAKNNGNHISAEMLKTAAKVKRIQRRKYGE